MRELRALTEGARELRVEKLTIITMDEDGIEKADYKKIEIMSTRRWCAGQEPV